MPHPRRCGVTRGHGEDYSDVIVRLAQLEAGSEWGEVDRQRARRQNRPSRRISTRPNTIKDGTRMTDDAD